MGELDDRAEEVAEFRKRIEECRMPEKVLKEADKQLKRLEKMHPDTAEAATVRTYMEWMVEIPWSHASQDKSGYSSRPKKVLNEDHYDLEKVKERILEYLAVRKLKEKLKGPILCFVGPPGVGKTSVGKSIARALGREFVRMSLGGVRDEAENQGTSPYVRWGPCPDVSCRGSSRQEPIIPCSCWMKSTKSAWIFAAILQPRFLEVLDPEQNHAFTDHYLGVPFDLSNVMFITTANLMDPILSALRDRMEIIEIPGYTEEEKLGIARRFLIPRQLEEHGISEKHFRIADPAVQRIVTHYTREAGVRNLERALANAMRKVARRVAEGKPKLHTITPHSLRTYIGIPKYLPETEKEKDQVGLTIGLAWTETGGETLHIEATGMQGKGNLTLTGHLGDVMKESAHAALSYVRAQAGTLGIKEEIFSTTDIHIHVPAGAIPKDGPSAGITMATALASSLANIPARHDVAMTGEITLRGRILPIGGLKEKILAAKRASIPRIILPKRNEKDLEELPKHLLKGVKIIFVETVDQVFAAALHRPSRARVTPKPSKPTRAKTVSSNQKKRVAALPAKKARR